MQSYKIYAKGTIFTYKCTAFMWAYLKVNYGQFDQNSSYIPPFFAVFAQMLGLFAQNVGFCPYFLHIAHLGIPEICAIARKYEFIGS
jgi:hypothetical protein